MRNLFLLLTLSGLSALTRLNLQAGLPLPSLTFFGMFLDEFGWPYPTDDYVEVYADGLKILSKNLSDATGNDYNFLVRIPYDSGGRFNDYSPDVITPGDNVTIKLIDNGTGQTVLSTNFVCNLPPGSVVTFNASSGTDSLGDGLPDDLRRWIWSAIGDGTAFDPTKVRASDDSDGDGVSNLNEFLAGTDPANAEDLLKVLLSRSSNSNVAQLTFFSVPGKRYQVQSGILKNGESVWTTAGFANSPDATSFYSEVRGTGHFLSLFLPATDTSHFFRVVVTPSLSGARILP